MDAQERAKHVLSNLAKPEIERSIRDAFGLGLGTDIAEQIRQAEQAAREGALEKAAQVADASAPLLSGSPGPLFDAGWNTACGGVAGAIRALKEVV